MGRLTEALPTAARRTMAGMLLVERARLWVVCILVAVMVAVATAATVTVIIRNITSTTPGVVAGAERAVPAVIPTRWLLSSLMLHRGWVVGDGSDSSLLFDGVELTGLPLVNFLHWTTPITSVISLLMMIEGEDMTRYLA